MNILVTGGGGFLGSAVCRQLAERGHDVSALQRRPATHLESFGVRSIEADIDDADAVARAAEGCGAIVHTAGKAGIWGDPADFRRVNVDGTANVLRACGAHGIPFLVHTSSPSVVHAGGDIEGGDESLPLATRFSAPYPETKAEAERLVTRANSATLRTVSLRPHLIWGPGDPHILPRLVAKAGGGRLALPAPHKVIDTIFVENAALAHVLALEELLGEGRCAGKAYFVTNHEPLPQGDPAEAICDGWIFDLQLWDLAEEDLARELLNSLRPEQRRLAIVSTEAPRDVLLVPGRETPLRTSAPTKHACSSSTSTPRPSGRAAVLGTMPSATCRTRWLSPLPATTSGWPPPRGWPGRRGKATIRASLPGEYHVQPTHAEQMYFPDVWGRSRGELFSVVE